MIGSHAARVAACVFLLAACSDSPSGPPTYTVVYRLTASAGITFDSVKYEDPQGMLLKVAGPPSNWMIILTAGGGSYVQGTAWVQAQGSGATATLKVTWTQSGVSTASDSSTATTSAAGGFTLDIPRRRI